MRRTLYEIAKSRAAAGLSPQVFNDDFENLVIYVNRIDPATNTLERVVIADDRNPDQRSTLFAREGRLMPNEGAQMLVLRLLDGSIHTLARDEESYHKTDFAEYDVRLDLTTLTTLTQTGASPKEMTLDQLRAALVRRSSKGRGLAPVEVELHRKFSIPFACFVFGIIAIPLGIQPVRAVRSRGFAVSLALTFCYYVFLTGGETLALGGYLPAVVALWIPNVVLGALGIYLFIGATNERPGRDGPAPGRIAADLRALVARRLGRTG
jgi:lipopolysaccharide export system permease protein